MKAINFKNILLLIFTGVFLIIISCEKIDENPDLELNNLKGLFVVCEGTFGLADGDITYYNTMDGSIIKNLFYSANHLEAGDVVQSFAIADTLGFIAVNNSQKLIVVNMRDFKLIKTIEGFSHPRCIIRADETSMYVSNGNGFADNYIYRIELAGLTKMDSIEVSTGPESLIKVGTKVYAAISGGWNNDGKTVIEIDTRIFKTVNDFGVLSCPVDIVADADNNIWVYCKGVADYTNYPDVSYSDMGLCKIDISTSNVSTFPFTSMASVGINNLAISKDKTQVYYLNDGLYTIPSNGTALPSANLVGKSFYGIDVDPKSGNIIALDHIDSKAIVYNESGIKQFEFETGTFPNSVTFSY